MKNRSTVPRVKGNSRFDYKESDGTLLQTNCSDGYMNQYMYETQKCIPKKKLFPVCKF